MIKNVSSASMNKLVVLIVISVWQLHCYNSPLALAIYLPSYEQLPQTSSLEPQAPVITPFSFNQNVHENQRSSVLCTISSGDLPVTISWLKDGQLLTPMIVQAKKIIIKTDTDQSILKFSSVRLDQAGNYTCVAKNRAGVQSHSAQLVVHAEPRWLREPPHEPIVASRGQTVVIDCQAIGWPKPQQTWLIKTHAHSEFEPLTATGRISLAANGSLVIRNADKSDEANYLCKSFNGIGKGVNWSTSLKVTVPAHFGSAKQQTSTVRKQSQVQLRCDAHGDEPLTIEWYKNKQLITSDTDSRYTVHNSRLQNGLISLLLVTQAQRQDNSLFECVTRNPVGKDRLSIELIVQEEPDTIQELQATQINSRSVTLMWSAPYDGRSGITNYMFQYKRLQLQEASAISLSDFDFMDSIALDMSTSGANALAASAASVARQSTNAIGGISANAAPDEWQQASRLMVPEQINATTGVRSVTIEKLDPSSKYLLRALAINSVGQSKFSQPLEFTTMEEAPVVGPTNIKALAINSTSIQVSWDEIPKSKQLGQIHGYYVGYRPANASSAAQNFIYKPFIINELVLQNQQQLEPNNAHAHSYGNPSTHRLETIITGLRRDTGYEITVVAFNSRGSGPSSDFVLCKTIEMEIPKPVRLQIRRESNESIFIEWQRDPTDQSPVDDYMLYQEKNSVSQEWLQVRLPGNQTQYKAPGLKCGTRYQFYIIAHNKIGKSLASEVVSASTSGALPVIPSKSSLIKMVNSTCLLVNLNSFQDNGCRIKTFTVRYRIEKTYSPSTHGSLSGASSAAAILPSTASTSSGIGASSPSQSLSASSNLPLASGSGNGHQESTLRSDDHFIATHAALTSGQAVKAANGIGSSINAAAQQAGANGASEWITIRPKSNAKHQRANDEDRMEFLCDLNPDGEYTIHVAASNDVGRSEIEYNVLMSSDELRYSIFKEMLELLSGMQNFLAYIPSVIVFLLAGLFLSLVCLVLYTTVIKYYQKFVIMQNQMRATRRAKADEKRRRKFANNSRQSQQVDQWVEKYEIDDEDIEGDDEDDDDDSSVPGSNSGHHQFFNPTSGHYQTNIANSAFDTSSIDSPCNKFGNGSCMSTASTDSTQGRFHCLNSKQYVKLNDYSMLPSISASLSPQNDIYGTATGRSAQQNTSSLGANSMYYSTLRRTNMQTYLPQQQQQHRRQSRNVSDIYGYYIAPGAAASIVPTSQAQQQQAANEVANSIFVPPQQIIYSAPNVRQQPVFL